MHYLICGVLGVSWVQIDNEVQFEVTKIFSFYINTSGHLVTKQERESRGKNEREARHNNSSLTKR